MEWFHRLLCDHLDKVLSAEIRKLMIFLPPQHGKSELTSRRFPAYALGKNPDLKIVACTYSANLARKFNREVRRIIDTPRYRELFGGTTLMKSGNTGGSKGTWIQTQDEFEVFSRTGGYKSMGVMGPLTGNRIDLGVVDDPIKDRLEAQSSVYRNRLWDWWTDVFSTRLHNDSRIVFTCTRWHEDDLAGRILAREGQDWKIFLLPGLREESTPYNLYPADTLLTICDPRATGEALWPSRHSREKALALKRNSERTFAAMIQQRPSPAEGDIIRKEWIRIYEERPRFEKVVQSWDCAFEGGERNDYVACTVWGKTGSRAYLLYMTRGKWDMSETIANIRRVSALFPESSEKYIERKANGPAMVNLLQREIPGLIPIDVSDSKEMRAWACSFLFEAGNVYFPKDRTWAQETIDELAAFPHGRHDDIVDTVTQALTRLFLYRQGRAVLAMV
jgi:predicted phage terminase large subunit-like protein